MFPGLPLCFYQETSQLSNAAQLDKALELPKVVSTDPRKAFTILNKKAKSEPVSYAQEQCSMKEACTVNPEYELAIKLGISGKYKAY